MLGSSRMSARGQLELLDVCGLAMKGGGIASRQIGQRERLDERVFLALVGVLDLWDAVGLCILLCLFAITSADGFDDDFGMGLGGGEQGEGSVGMYLLAT